MLLLDIKKNGDLVQKIWSRYLRDERHYDAWGSLGKLLVILEVLTDEGFDLQYLIGVRVDFQKVVNMVFPRSFQQQTGQRTIQILAREIGEYFSELQERYTSEGMDQPNVYESAFIEAIGKFGITTGELERILKRSNQQNAAMLRDEH